MGNRKTRGGGKPGGGESGVKGGDGDVCGKTGNLLATRVFEAGWNFMWAGRAGLGHYGGGSGDSWASLFCGL